MRFPSDRRDETSIAAYPTIRKMKKPRLNRFGLSKVKHLGVLPKADDPRNKRRKRRHQLPETTVAPMNGIGDNHHGPMLAILA
jgi:hypothetical protein